MKTRRDEAVRDRDLRILNVLANGRPGQDLTSKLSVAIAGGEMSTQHGPFVKYRCFNDCQQSGCPGHVVRAVYHHTSDTLSFESESDKFEIFDPERWKAMQEAERLLNGEKLESPDDVREDCAQVADRVAQYLGRNLDPSGIAREIAGKIRAKKSDYCEEIKKV